jgi:hypothetical protein
LVVLLVTGSNARCGGRQLPRPSILSRATCGSHLLGGKHVPTLVMAEAVAMRRDADLAGALAELVNEG